VGYIKLDKKLLIDILLTLSPAEFKVYLALMLHRNYRTRLCCPSEKLIAEDCRLSRRAVVLAIQTLKTRGLLTLQRVGTKAGGYHNTYVLIE
jgi:predicted transcriptional regulator